MLPLELTSQQPVLAREGVMILAAIREVERASRIAGQSPPARVRCWRISRARIG